MPLPMVTPAQLIEVLVFCGPDLLIEQDDEKVTVALHPNRLFLGEQHKIAVLEHARSRILQKGMHLNILFGYFRVSGIRDDRFFCHFHP